MAFRLFPVLAPFISAVFAAPTELPPVVTTTAATSEGGATIVVTATTGKAQLQAVEIQVAC